MSALFSYKQKRLEIYAIDCGKFNNCAIRLPSENNKWLSFNNHCRKERVPFMVYADQECTLQNMEMDMETSNYQVYKYEMRIWENRWRINAVCGIKIWLLCHFEVPSTSVRRAVINWKSVCIVLCCCVRYVCRKLYQTKSIRRQH